MDIGVVWCDQYDVSTKDHYCSNQGNALQLGTLSLEQCMAQCDVRSGSAGCII